MSLFEYPLTIAALTTSNRHEEDAINEDAILVNERLLCGEESLQYQASGGSSFYAAVSDGLHGTAGKIHAAKLLLAMLLDDYSTCPQDHPGRRLTRLHEAYSCLGSVRSDCRGMAATLVGAEIHHNRLMVFHVGDSRAWLIRHGKVRQLTDDHTYARCLFEDGEIDQRAFENAGQLANALDQYFVVDSGAIRPRNSLQTYLIEAGDLVLLSSDGINMIPEGLPSPPDEVELKLYLEKIVARAVSCGSDDNISIIAIKVGV